MNHPHGPWDTPKGPWKKKSLQMFEKDPEMSWNIVPIVLEKKKTTNILRLHSNKAMLVFGKLYIKIPQLTEWNCIKSPGLKP